jgi:hypothetical protein
MKPGKILPAAVILIAGLIMVLWRQQQAQEKGRTENESLARQVAASQTDRENFCNQARQAGSV